jgi:hypothetical protein
MTSVELESGAESGHVTLPSFCRLNKALKLTGYLHTLAFESKSLVVHCKCRK